MSSIRKCKYYIAGHCSFGENLCWFRHGENDNSFPQTITEFNCGFCGKRFDNKKEFMHHRKNEHIKYVSECRENEYGCCSFSGQDCWFKHSEKIPKNHDEENGFQNSEIIVRLFDMMEIFAQRMKSLEDQI